MVNYRINDILNKIEEVISRNNLEIAEEDKPKDEWGFMSSVIMNTPLT
jgi:hypothetical protein